MIKVFLCFSFFTIHCSLIFAQQHKIDSLHKLIQADKEDTTQVNHLISLASLLYTTNPDSTIVIVEHAALLAGNCHYQKGEARANSFIAIEYAVKGEYPKALDYFLKALNIAEAMGDKQLQASILDNLGNVFKLQSDYPKALDYYLKAMKIDEEIGNKNGNAAELGNIGILYEEEGDYAKALDYDLRAIKISEETGNKNAIAADLGNIGVVYQDQGNKLKALDYYQKALKMAEEIGDKYTSSYNLGNIGVIYDNLGDYANALDYDTRSLKVNEEIGNKSGIATNLGSIGSLYTRTGKFDLGEEYLKRAIGLDDSIGEQNGLRQNEEKISMLYDSTGHYQLALEYYKKAMRLKDTLFNIEKNKALTRKEMTYELDKKEAVAEAERKKQKAITFSVMAVLILVLVFAGFIFRSLRITRKQKGVIEEKNKEILDSINYAKRLQDAILPPLNLVKQYLPDSFVLYKPKDIVAGDFYWMEVAPLGSPEGGSKEPGNVSGVLSHIPPSEGGEAILIAAADCTGHGVPGALVSVVCSNALNRTVKEFKITEPGKILDKVRELVLETFEKSESNVQDGMDISLIAISRQSSVDSIQIQWSGAYNSLCYIADGKMMEIPADKQPIGKTDNPKPFTTHTINLSPLTQGGEGGGLLYLFTDGYADQFGGPKGKKFKYKQLMEKLSVISCKSMTEQKDILEKTFEDWKGSLEQVDDVLIIGIRV
ncbi:MAG TPA: tetratricopeptide repeat protein [Bacteroidia bacterium]|nr:tetratricopeptide repeat protein [Bacteroidia bacterium]